MTVRKQGGTLKGKNADVKSAKGLKIKAQSGEIGVRDVFVSGGIKGSKRATAASAAGAKAAVKSGLAGLYSQVLSDDEYGENGAITSVLSSGKKTGENLYRGTKKAVGKARLEAEKKYLESHASPLRTRTAFSPFKSRRREYGRAVADKVSKPFRNAGTALAARIRFFTGKAARRVPARTAKTVRLAGRGAGKVAAAGKKIMSGARLVLKALLAVIKAGAGVLLPLLLIVAVVVIAISGVNGGAEGSASVLTPLSASGSLTGGSFHISITAEEDELVSFDVADAAGGFLYTAEDVTLHGHVSGDELIIEGTVGGENVALKGTIGADGNISMYGFMGERARAALDGEFINPFGARKYVLTSLFGPRIHPITGEYKNHDGYDMCAESGEGSPIYAASSGTVLTAGEYGGHGNCVIIDHGEGLHSLYGHMNAVTVRVGDEVHAGQQVGTEGNTGLSDGPHLHFEVRLDGKAVDGAEYYPLLYENATSVWY